MRAWMNWLVEIMRTYRTLHGSGIRPRAALVNYGQSWCVGRAVGRANVRCRLTPVRRPRFALTIEIVLVPSDPLTYSRTLQRLLVVVHAPGNESAVYAPVYTEIPEAVGLFTVAPSTQYIVLPTYANLNVLSCGYTFSRVRGRSTSITCFTQLSKSSNFE